jgi:mRNA-degrading endonuclease toxin of MazEF toxin-antitoxin module
MAAYCPDAGEILWLDFLQAIANEQAGRRPVLVLSPRAFNELRELAMAEMPRPFTLPYLVDLSQRAAP